MIYDLLLQRQRDAQGQEQRMHIGIATLTQLSALAAPNFNPIIPDTVETQSQDLCMDKFHLTANEHKKEIIYLSILWII